MSVQGHTAPELSKALGARQFFTIGFGCIIGVAWIVVLGEWLTQAGPLGAILGFLGGGVLMLLIGVCYGEVGTMMPVAGGEVAYAYEVYGAGTSYVVGWLMALVYVAVVAFEAISTGWVLSVLVPGMAGPVLYSFAGSEVSLGNLVIGVGGTLVLTWLNYRGAKAAAGFQDVATWLLIGLVLVFVAVGLVGGRPENAQPWFQTVEGGAIAWGGVLSVLVTAPFWYGGFNVIPQVIEEKAAGTPLRAAGSAIVYSLAGAIVFYCLVILSTSFVLPWGRVATLELPAAAAFRAAFASPALANVVLVAALLGIITTWNSVFIAGSRVLFAFGRARIISPAFGRVHAVFGSPATAVLFVGVVGGAATFLGRSAILPIANLGASCFAFAYLLTCFGLIRLRRREPGRARPYRVPGGVATALLASLGAIFMLVVSLYQPYANARGSVPLEWVLLGIWVGLGVLFWVLGRRFRETVSEAERRRLVLALGAVDGGEGAVRGVAAEAN